MKLLYVDAHLHFINPTNTLTPALASLAASDIDYFGPGYSTEDDVKAGLLRYIDRHGPYDAIMIGPNVPIFAKTNPSALEEVRGYVSRYTALSSPPEMRMVFYRDILNTIDRVPIQIRLVSLLNFDWYDANQKHVDTLESVGFYVIGPNADFCEPIETLPEWAWSEKHFSGKKNVISDTWRSYLVRNDNRVICLHHFVADGEFSFRGLEERREKISVPGIGYVLRERAELILRRNNVKLKEKRIFKAFLLANRIGLPVFSRFLALRMFNASFFEDLIDSRCVYTARDGSGMTVRKFFEIPAAGAVMLCAAPYNFEALGFQSGVNYISTMPEDLPEALHRLKRAPDAAQKLAAAGRKLVFERHCLRARAEQLSSSLAAIRNGRFYGTSWQAGKFTIRTEPADGLMDTCPAAGPTRASR